MNNEEYQIKCKEALNYLAKIIINNTELIDEIIKSKDEIDDMIYKKRDKKKREQEILKEFGELCDTLILVDHVD